jgi:hypothetical protein
MKPARALDIASPESEVVFLGFALSDCVVEIDKEAARYLRAVHRTALELAIPNRFGIEVGGFWLMPEQLEQLRKLPECYPINESASVRRAVNAYVLAQSQELHTWNLSSIEKSPLE